MESINQQQLQPWWKFHRGTDLGNWIAILKGIDHIKEELTEGI